MTARDMTDIPNYHSMRLNRPIGDVKLQDHASKLTGTSVKCECGSKNRECGADQMCYNRSTNVECTSKNCTAGLKCLNRLFSSRVYVRTNVFKTENRGLGLKSAEAISRGSFVIEYVGDVINIEEYERRTREMNARGETDTYFMEIDKSRIIDARHAGNKSRFVNHSCQPNCELQKWVVAGETRVGLFAKEDIPEG